MKTNLFFFSTTGNSLTVAKDIATKLPETQIFSIPKVITQEIDLNADNIGFIFPVYFSGGCHPWYPQNVPSPSIYQTSCLVSNPWTRTHVRDNILMNTCLEGITLKNVKNVLRKRKRDLHITEFQNTYSTEKIARIICLN